MKQYPVSIRWTHSFGFRSGEWANVIGVCMVEPKDREPRLCYSVMYQDGTYDGIPISDSDNYEIKANKVTPITIEATLKIAELSELQEFVKSVQITNPNAPSAE